MPELRHVHLWDGHQDRNFARIVWDGGTILDVSPDDPPITNIPLSVIPGLIDTHTHMASYAGSQRVDYRTWPLITYSTTRVLHAYANAQRAMAIGVTTLRDLEADTCQISLKDVLDEKLLAGPRILAFGMVSMTGGHADLFTPPAVSPRPLATADGPDAVRKRVREYARMGMDGIKIATGGGVLSMGDKPAWRNYTAAENAAIVDEAHALGMRVAAHAHDVAAVDAALTAGVDSLEHGTLMSAEQATLIGDRGLTVAPTLLINDRIANGEGGVPQEMVQKARALVARRDQAMQLAHRVGVQFVLGTDSSGQLMPFGLQWDELQAMQKVIGLTSQESLQSATSAAARAIGWDDDRLGFLKPGYLADLVVLRGTPWIDVQAFSPQDIVAVVVRGDVVSGTLPY